MKKYLVFSMVIAIVIFVFSCEGGTSTFEVNCAECYVNEPDSFELEVKLSINETYSSVYLEFFKGDVETGELSWEGEVTDPVSYLLVPVDAYYSVKATYKDGTKTLIAIDGDRMVSRYIADACDEDCWIVKGGYLDVRLKY